MERWEHQETGGNLRASNEAPELRVAIRIRRQQHKIELRWWMWPKQKPPSRNGGRLNKESETRYYLSLLGWTIQLLRRAEIRRGYLGPRHERSQIPAHRPPFFKCQGATEGRHAGAPAFQNRTGKLAVRSRRLPASIREVGNIGDVPDASSVHAVAADAITAIEANHYSLFLFGASHPVPRSTHLAGGLYAFDAEGRVSAALHITIMPRAPGLQYPSFRISRRERDKYKKNAEQAENSADCARHAPEAVIRSHSHSR